MAVASRDRQRPRFLRFALALVLTTAVVGTVATAAYAFTDYVGSGAVASITNNGYYRARCTNEGTIVFPVACWAWNYSP